MHALWLVCIMQLECTLCLPHCQSNCMLSMTTLHLGSCIVNNVGNVSQHHEAKCLCDFACSDAVLFACISLLLLYWGEPERAPYWSNGVPRDVYMYLSMFVCIVRHSINKCPHVLIHWTASNLQCVINSVNFILFK